MFCTLFAQISTRKIFFESNVWWKFLCTLFCRNFDEDTLLWIKCICSKMFCIVFWPKLDEDRFLWIKFVVQNILCSILYKARAKLGPLNQICGWQCLVICFAPSSMKIQFFESNVLFKMFCTVLHKNQCKCASLNQMCGSKCVFYSVLSKTQRRYVFLNQMCG